MPVLSGTRKEDVEQKEPEIKRRKQTIDWEEIDNFEAHGYTFGFFGRTKTGKTTTAFSLANLRKEMIPFLEKDYPLIVKHLKDGSLPEINKIIVVDTESVVKKQMGQIEQRKMLKYITGRVSIKYKAVPIQVPDSDLEDLEEGRVISKESAQLIYDKVEMIEAHLKWAHDNADKNTLIIFDSASKYLDLLDAKGTIQYNRRIAKYGEKSVKQEGFHKYTFRKIWWDATMDQLRSTEGWVISTFRVVPTSDYSVNVALNKGLEPNYTKTEALKSTGFALDMEYDFDFGQNSFTKSVTTRNGRWVDEEDDSNNQFKLTKKSRFSGLQMIENILKCMDDPDMFGDDVDYELPPLDGDS